MRKHIRHQQVVVLAQRVQCLAETDEIAWDEFRSLVNELIKRVLAVGPGLAQKIGPVWYSTRVPSESRAFRFSMVNCCK